MCKFDWCPPSWKEKVYILLLCGNSESNSKETWLAYESHEKIEHGHILKGCWVSKLSDNIKMCRGCNWLSFLKFHTCELLCN